jgi:hypothetical protein
MLTLLHPRARRLNLVRCCELSFEVPRDRHNGSVAGDRCPSPANQPSAAGEVQLLRPRTTSEVGVATKQHRPRSMLNSLVLREPDGIPFGDAGRCNREHPNLVTPHDQCGCFLADPCVVLPRVPNEHGNATTCPRRCAVVEAWAW